MTTHSDGGSLSHGRRTARLYEPFVAAVTFGRYRPFLAREVVRLGPDGEVVGVDASGPKPTPFPCPMVTSIARPAFSA